MSHRPTTPFFDLQRNPDGTSFMEVSVTGIALLRFTLTNKGTAFSPEERRALGLEGLLPAAYNTIEEQVARTYRGFQAAKTPLDKYQYLRGLQERQEILFYAVLERHLAECLPIVYTPTVGEAVKQFSMLYQNPRGLSLSPLTIDRAHEVVRSYPMSEVQMIVATDSSAILGIGDQGWGGLAIPIGKLALYTVAGGVSPFNTMAVALDVGTDRGDLIADPAYLGVRQPRLSGDAYLAFTDAFVDAVRARWPHAIIQWEDLAKGTAFTVLDRYRKQLPSFNDDIQGTGAVALAGVLAACRHRGERLAEQNIVIHGAGAGGAGVAYAIRSGLMRAGLSEAEAGKRVYVLDSRGLLTSDGEMEEYKRPLAQDAARVASWGKARRPDLMETVRGARATVLLGLSGQPGAFPEAVVRQMAENTERPVIFPLSNPTSSAEAKPEDVLRWTDGKAIVAAGSPFDPVTIGGKTIEIGQGNNAFIFPGLGFGAIQVGAREITDAMVLAGSYALDAYTAERHGETERVYPPVEELQEVSIRVASAVAKQAIADGVADSAPKDDVDHAIRAAFWRAHYMPIVAKK